VQVTEGKVSEDEAHLRGEFALRFGQDRGRHVRVRRLVIAVPNERETYVSGAAGVVFEEYGGAHGSSVSGEEGGSRWSPFSGRTRGAPAITSKAL